MRKRIFLLLFAVVAATAGHWLLLTRLQNEDISFRGYLSGMIAVVAGGGENKLIRVNLHNYSIALYEDGVMIKQAKVAAIGDPANSTRTPVGNFRILSKEKRHISRPSGIIMPLSLRFYGPYYFHDVPFHRDGTVISTQYSNGCIRLQGDLAQEVYQWASIGTRVQIYHAEFAKTADAPTVYLLTTDGYRRPIANLEAFQVRGYRWRDVAIVPAQELAGLPEGNIIQ